MKDIKVWIGNQGIRIMDSRNRLHIDPKYPEMYFGGSGNFHNIYTRIPVLHPGILGLILHLGLVCLIPYHVIPHPVVAMVTWKYVFIIRFYNRKIGMFVECFVMNETIPAFCLVIFPIWHYGKIPFTRAIRIVHVFPAGPLGIRN